ncbi:MAG: hypothetical protein Q4E54_03620 [Lachnospiraceae bacterium]|nr:hypothetical protein [Lachnospiraceae bacterium]
MKKFCVSVLVLLMVLMMCGCTKKVKDLEITLHLPYGDRTGTYTGEMNHDLPNGEGVFKTENEYGEKWQHEGHFVDGLFEGYGKETWEAGGKIQEGTYAGGVLNGQGTWTDEQGRIIYKGEYKDNHFDGEGAFYCNGEISYQGPFVNDIPDREEYIKAAGDLAYADAVGDPDRYYNSAVRIQGEILEVFEYDDGYVDYRIDVNPDDDSESVFYAISYTDDYKDQTYTEGDMITVYGQYYGLDTYQEANGTTMAEPAVVFYYVE